MIFEPKDTDYESRVRASFARQTFMRMLGARMTVVSAGSTEIELPFRDDLAQQHGYLHAAVVTGIVDSACGYAALSLTPAGKEVLTIEYKINLAAPATGEKMIARGRVLRPGRTVTLCAGDVFAVTGGKEKLVATMLATMIVTDAED